LLGTKSLATELKGGGREGEKEGGGGEEKEELDLNKKLQVATVASIKIMHNERLRYLEYAA
jgi:hypothetical protein